MNVTDFGWTELEAKEMRSEFSLFDDKKSLEAKSWEKLIAGDFFVSSILIIYNECMKDCV